MSTPSGRTRKERAKGYFSQLKSKQKETKLNSISQAFSRKRVRVAIDNSRFKMLPMCGFEVKLPEGINPYPTQKLMMVRILMALKTRQNVLAESPTGSGKTLALLASTCAWMAKYQKSREEARTNCQMHGAERAVPTFNVPMTPRSEADEFSESTNVVDLEMDETGEFHEAAPQTQASNANVDGDGFRIAPHTYEDELNGDFVSSPAPSKLPLSVLRNSYLSEYADTEVADEKLEKGTKEKPVVTQCTCLPRVRIYYGTRTHKQIGQVVKEFRRLPYAGVIRHTIMGSREQSCINDAARKAPDITAHCKELISEKGLGCQYRSNMNTHRLNQNPKHMRNLVETYADVVFDMEDLVDALKTSKPAVCPYFTSTRVLTQDADLIFCPFSYLVDPIIRNSSDVTLKNSIVILDEAHNIEDTCRESASYTFYEKEIADALHSLKTKEQEVHELVASYVGRDLYTDQESQDLAKLQDYSRSYGVLYRFVRELYEWFVEMATPVKKVTPDKFNNRRTVTKSWAVLADSLLNQRLQRKLISTPGSADHDRIQHAYGCFTARGEDSSADQVMDKLKPSSVAIILMEKWLYFQEYFVKEEFRRTYRLNIMIEPNSSFGQQSQTPSQMPRGSGMRDGQGSKNIGYSQATENIWLDAKSPTGLPAIAEGCKTSISLWCMSPELTFMSAFDEVRTVVLASGTLCPIETLKTELGMEFKVQMEGKQVIPKEQIFASVLPVGPAGSRIAVTYQNTENNPVVMSQIVEIIENICLTVPHGVLCFLPSYRLLTKITELMAAHGVDHRIKKRKVILEEPRRSSDLNSLMTTFDDVIDNPREYGPTVDGALMFAVFRGKVSEGIDFADNKARAVISIGIPYPMFYDGQVVEKRKYNDENSKMKGILTGEQWYATQGYRALNQALGRCLRHRNDWGALILIDERLASQANANHAPSPSTRVSQWIRDQLVVYQDYNQFQSSLSGFVRNMTASQKVEKSELKLEAGPPKEIVIE